MVIDHAQPSDNPNNSRMSGPVLWVAVFTLLAFGALAAWMLASASRASDVVWQRQVFIYSSVQALVFTAAGALFGVQVKRDQIEKANQSADKAANLAAQAVEDQKLASAEAARGRAQAATVRGLAGVQLDQHDQANNHPQRTTRGGTEPSGSLDPLLSALLRVSNELFPTLDSER